MTDLQFEALLAALAKLTSRIDSLSNSLAETANLLHDDLQDVVSSIDMHGSALTEISDRLIEDDED